MKTKAILAALFAGVVAAQELRLADALEFRAETAEQKSSAEKHAIPATWYDTSNRAAVAQAYLQDYLTLKNTPLGWTGNLGTGDPGTTSETYRSAVVRAINWYRAMAGVRASITLDPVLNAKAQKGALMMAANNALSHTPPSTWRYYTTEGAEALGKSNLCQGFTSDPGCMELYMIDEGANNASVGHRRWILYPPSTTMGTGDVLGGFNLWNTLWVFPTTTVPPVATRDTFVAWPPPGYVPRQVVAPRWSFSLSDADFANATVSMSQGGSAITPNIEYRNGRYGDPAIVWRPAIQPGASDTAYDVTVANVRRGGALQPPFTYRVIIFDPGAGAGFSWSPASASVPAAGGTFSTQLNVTPAGAAWTVTSSAAWVQIVSAPSGNGTSSVQYRVLENNGATRSVTLSAGGQAFTIQQAAGAVAPGCSYAVNAGAIQTPANGARVPVTLSAPAGCTWTAESDSTWAQVFPLSGTGSQTLSISVIPNFSARARAANVSIGNQIVTVSQPAAAATPDERFVTMLYYNFMGRLPSPSEITFQVRNGLQAGASRAELARRFFESPEFGFGGRLIAGLYVGLLNRDAEYSGWLFQRNALSSGQVDQTQQTRNFLDSAEFRLKYGTPSDADLVRLLYSQVLRRSPSADEIAFHTGTMTRIGRAGFATNLLASTEFRTNASSRLTAFLLYAALLNRGPSEAELQARASQLEQGASNASLIEAVVSTSEFQSLLN